MSGKDRIIILNFDNISAKRRDKKHFDAVEHGLSTKNCTKLK